MFDFYQKRKLRALANSPVTQFILLVLVLMIGWSAYVRFDIAMEMRDRRIEAERQTLLLEERKGSLETQVEYLSSERGVEAEMRRQFDIALPGEQVVVIVDDQKKEPEVLPLATSTDLSGDKRWFQFWR